MIFINSIFSIVKKLSASSLSFRKWAVHPATFIRTNPTANQIRLRLGLSDNTWSFQSDSESGKELIKKYSVNLKSLVCEDFNGTIGLIGTRHEDEYRHFQEACAYLKIKGRVIDQRGSYLIDEAKRNPCEVYLIRPGHKTGLERSIYRELTEALSNEAGAFVYPSLREQSFYESKRQLAYFLRIHGIPHPETEVFFSEPEALKFLAECSYPQVFKTAIGASASGVEILETRKKAVRFTKNIFRNYYVGKSLCDYRDVDYGYVLFQRFIPHVREYRVIMIGDSWFGHEKAAGSNKYFMSGSGVNKWTPPSYRILDFCEDISKKFGFSCMCFDIFEDEAGSLYVNEMQTWFGSHNPSQMYIDGVPGRYIKRGGAWIFEPGLFNVNKSILLRIVDAVNQYASRKNNTDTK